MSQEVSESRAPQQSIRPFLITVYGVAIAVWIGLRLTGFLPDIVEGIARRILIAVLFAAPLAAAYVAARKNGERFYHRVSILPVNPLALLAILVTTLAAFALSFGMSGLIGAAEPDWSAPMLTGIGINMLTPAMAIVFALLTSIFVIIPIATVLALPFEIGWRVYMLPKLKEDYGRLYAYVIIGLLAATAAFPAFMEGPILLSIANMLRVCVFAIVFSIFLGEIMRITDHVGLCAFAIGCFLSQAEGVWQFIYPELTPWISGNTGLIPILIWAIPAFVLYRQTDKKKVKRSQPKRPEIRRAPRHTPRTDAPAAAAPSQPEPPVAEVERTSELEEAPPAADPVPNEEPPDGTAMPEIDIAVNDVPKEAPKPKPEPDHPIELAPLGPSEDDDKNPPAIVDLPEPPDQLDLIEAPKPKKKATRKKKASTRKKKATAKKKAPKKKPAKKKTTKKRATKKKPAKKKAAKKKSSGS